MSRRVHGHLHLLAQASDQRGIATLTVVMVLFFIVSMVAAYTSRNLVFEQRTSTNQYRSTQALEAADAGLNWVLALLNTGRIDTACRATGDPTATTFRDRYLGIDSLTGDITARVAPTGGGPLMPSCVFNGASWDCQCMLDGAPVVATPAGVGVFPAFRTRFTTFPARPGVVRIEVNGCTRNDNACLNFPAAGADNEGRVTVTALLALKGAITTIPSAPLTARGSVNLGGAALTAANSSPVDKGITVHAGGAVATAGLVLYGKPGTPGDRTVVDSDSLLSALDADRMFSSTFGMSRSIYRDQPGAVMLDCALGCGAAAVRAAVTDNPGRTLWLQGDLDIDSAGDIGSLTDPVAIVVNGNVTFSTPVSIFGVVYTQAANWASSGTSTVNGAFIAEGNVTGSSTATLVYDGTILNRVRLGRGSFALVPGSWRDFQ